jgi:predicted kinase
MGAEMMEAIGRRLKLSSKTIADCTAVARYHMDVYSIQKPSKLRRLALKLRGFEEIVMKLYMADHPNNAPITLPVIPQFPSGEYIMNLCGMEKGGRMVGRLMAYIEDYWVNMGTIPSDKLLLSMRDKYAKQIMIIMRGIPGSGKSTMAKKIADQRGALISSADNFFFIDGKYTFRPDRIGDAHRYCQSNLTRDLRLGKDVIVDNTNTQLFDMEWYINLAKHSDIPVYKCEIPFDRTKPEYYAARNIHGVPVEKIQRMMDRWQSIDLPEYGEQLPW